MEERNELLRAIPKVDEVLKAMLSGDDPGDASRRETAKEMSHAEAADTVRRLTGELRQAVLEGRLQNMDEMPDAAALAEQAAEYLRNTPEHHLRRVINATGVVLHTNLGRAVLPEKAVCAAAEAARHPSNLEYDLSEGVRGSRQVHVEEILKKITGAEAAMAVNNNAAAVLLCLSALAAGKEVIVSRGEEVEIGGSFRVPDIMKQSGASLVEVGTTNRTKPEDYRDAVTENTAALLKVHTSNYRIIGFTRETTLQELSELKQDLPLLYDMGSGLFIDLDRYGIDEPAVSQALKAGADLVMFSGDKLLGGPQAGFAVGKKALIDRMKKHPLARAFRVDKMTLAAAEAVLKLYLDPDRALREIPTLRQITAGEEELCVRAVKLQMQMEQRFMGQGYLFLPEPCGDRVGGGAAPETALPGYAVTIRGLVPGRTPEQLASALRNTQIPVIGRIADGRLWLSLRTVEEEEEETLVQSIAEALQIRGREGIS